MQVKGIIRRTSQPCENCGEVRDLTGEYPDVVLLCDPCNGRFTCRCCRLPHGEFEGRAREFGGSPDEYVCPYCRGGCSYDTPEGGCRFLSTTADNPQPALVRGMRSQGARTSMAGWRTAAF